MYKICQEMVAAVGDIHSGKVVLIHLATFAIVPGISQLV
jgi:hypothetical protein